MKTSLPTPYDGLSSAEIRQMIDEAIHARKMVDSSLESIEYRVLDNKVLTLKRALGNKE